MMGDVRFYLSLFFRRLHYFLILTAVGLAVGLTLALLLPPRYVAQARLVVESEQIPDELAASTVRTGAAEQLQLIQQRILTRGNLLDMANRLAIYRPLPGEPPSDLRPDQIVDDLRERITIRTTGGTARRGATVDATLVNVGFTAGDPQLSAQVANEVVTLILAENVRMRTGVAGQTLEFFQQEVARLDEELSQKSAQIVSFQAANKEALPDSQDFRRGQLAAAQERAVQIDRDTDRLRDQREGLVALYEATGQIGGSGAPLTSEALQLQQLQEQYNSIAAVLSDENPRVKVLRARISALETAVAEQSVAGGGIGLANPDGTPLTPFDIQLGDLENQLKFLDARRAEVTAQMDALQSSIEATPANSVALQALQRDYDNIRRQYDLAVANKARAETGDMIEALSKGQRISVIEQAVAPPEPASPNRPRLILAGLGGGMAMGFGLIALMELLNSAVRRPIDIVSKLDITPLATLSFIRTRREVVRRRVAIGAAFAVVLAGIPMGLWAVDTYYAPLDQLIENVMSRLPIAALERPGGTVPDVFAAGAVPAAALPAAALPAVPV
jgi:uncharacterized protein involved in exopolysaccharide biosynthesis